MASFQARAFCTIPRSPFVSQGGDVRPVRRCYIRTGFTQTGSEFLQGDEGRSWALMGRAHDKLMLGAARRGNVGRIQRLLAEGADVNAGGKYGNTPLVHASASGHADVVRLLLDAGAMPSMTTDDGGTALYWAASEGHGDVVQLLLDRGVEVDAMRDSGWTALTAAIYSGHELVAEILLDAGARGDRECQGKSMYQWALKHGRERVARYLEQRGSHRSRRV
jgi:ankyrin repeat protein